jgi:hypothetical protein
VSAIEEDEVSDITVADYTHLILRKVLGLKALLEAGSTVPYL